MHVILTNGAPFSGKDTFVKDFLKRYPRAKWVRFKDVLYTDSYARLFKSQSITFNEWVNICNDVKLKDYPLPFELTRKNILSWSFDILVNHKSKEELAHLSINNISGFNEMCLSPRNELIYESEKVIKVKHGEGGVAVRTAENMLAEPYADEKLYIFSDGGFNIEVKTLMKTLGIARNQLTIIRIEADGCTFDGDSREYILNPDFTLYNDKTDNFFKNADELGIYKVIDNVILQEKFYDFPEIYHHIHVQNETDSILKVTYQKTDDEIVLDNPDDIDEWVESFDWNKPPEEYVYFKIFLEDNICEYNYHKWSGELCEYIVTA